MADRPTVLFVCVQNAGRSQMAEALFNRAAEGRALGLSAGSRPADVVHPVVVDVLREIGLDVSHKTPKGLSDVPLDRVDVVVTMGCGDECPVFPGARRLDWELADPAEQQIDDVRAIRDEITRRVERLVRELS